MDRTGIYSINYWEHFVLNKFNIESEKEPFSVIISDAIAQRARAHPYLNDSKRRFCTYRESREELFLTNHGVVAVTKNPRHIKIMRPSFRIFSLQEHNLVHLAVDVNLPFDESKIIKTKDYFG